MKTCEQGYKICLSFGINLNDIKYVTSKATGTINNTMTYLYVLKAVYCIAVLLVQMQVKCNSVRSCLVKLLK